MTTKTSSYVHQKHFNDKNQNSEADKKYTIITQA